MVFVWGVYNRTPKGKANKRNFVKIAFYWIHLLFVIKTQSSETPGGGGTDLERGCVWMCGPEDPLFTPLLPLARVPFQAIESVRKTTFWENLEILASTASIFTQILALTSPKIWKFSAHKPPNLEIFSSQAPKFGNFPLTSPPFQRQMSVYKPHTLKIRAAHPYLKKKLSAPGSETKL